MKKSTSPLMRYLSILGVALLLLSCGTQKNVGYADGIYNESDKPEPKREETASNDLNNDYYKNYFGETVEEVEEINDKPEVFTDVDSYSSNYQDENADPENFTGNGGWGDASENVTINFIDNGWGNWGWGPGWGWGAGWGFGWNNWWGPGWGWGIGWGGWYGPGWGWGGGWYGPGWGYPGWGGGWYAGNGYAYVNSRRGYNAYNNIGRSNSLAGRTAVLGTTDYRGRSVTRLSQSRLNTDLTGRNRSTVATNARSGRNTSGYTRNSARSNNRSSQSVRNSNINRGSSSRATRSGSSRNGNSSYNNRSSNSRNSVNRNSSRSSRSRGYNPSRSTRSNSSIYRGGSSRSSSRGSMSRGGGSSRSSMSRGGGSRVGGSRGGGRGRG